MLAEVIIYAAALYVCIGVVFGVALLGKGLEKVDPAAANTSWWFRCLIFPGLVGLWPLLVRRWPR
jgi:hypothetical protein